MKNLFLTLLLFPIHIVFSQPTLTWQKTFGGSDYDNGVAIIKTSDGGYMLLCNVSSSDFDVTDNHYSGIFGTYDVFLIKLNNNLEVEWKKCFGGSLNEYGNDIMQLSDNSYIITGYTNSEDGDIFTNYGGDDAWVLRVDENGEKIWSTSCNGTENDYANSAIFIDPFVYVLGSTYSDNADGEFSGNPYGIFATSEAFVVKLDVNSGSILASNTFGSEGGEGFTSGFDGLLGNIYVAGNTSGIDGDVEENNGYSDIWFCEIFTLSLTLGSQNSIGGSGVDGVNYMLPDGWFCGTSSSPGDGDIIHNNTESNLLAGKITDSELEFQICTELPGVDFTFGLCEGEDEIIIAGEHSSGGLGSIENWFGGTSDALLYSLTFDADLNWMEGFGGSDKDVFNSVVATDDGGYLALGRTRSDDGQITNNYGDDDIWLVKIGGGVVQIEEENIINDITVSPNPAHENFTLTVPEDASVSSVQLIDAMGNLLKTSVVKSSANTISTIDIPAGIYTLILHTQASTYNKKIIIMH